MRGCGSGGQGLFLQLILLLLQLSYGAGCLREGGSREALKVFRVG